MKLRSLLFAVLLSFLATNTNAQSNNCATATFIDVSSGSACFNGTTLGATSSNTLYGACNPFSVNEVWVTFVAAGSNTNITVTPTGGTPMSDPMAVLDTDDCTDGAFLTCNTATGANPVTINWGTSAGATYTVAIATNGGFEGDFEICITSSNPSPSGGNACAGALEYCNLVANDGVADIDMTDMSSLTSSGTTPACFGPPPTAAQQDVWLAFEAQSTGYIEWDAMATGGAEFDWAVFESTDGTCASLTEVACNYFFNAGAGSTWFGQYLNGGTLSGGDYSDELNVTAGNTYFIMIDNYDADGTGFEFYYDDFGSSTASFVPIVDFSISPTGPTCTLPQNVTVTDNSQVGNGANLAWDYGNGTTTTGSPPAISSTSYTSAGTYNINAVYTTDNGNCTYTHTESIGIYEPLSATVATTDETCPGDCDGTAAVTASGGDGVYSYSWNPNVSSGPTASALCDGSYDVTISDGSGVCTPITETFSIAPGTDVTNPTITCPSNVTQGNDGGSCDAVVSIGAPTTSDNCSVVSVVNDYNGTSDASDTYPVGSTTVTWTVTDVGGNTASCSMTVTVNDTENPTISCPGNQNVNLDANCEYTLQDYTSMATAADNCSATVTQSPVPGTVINSTTTVTLTATDPSGNTATCTFDVVTTDNSNPTITCPADVTQANDAGQCNAAVSIPAPTTSDNCGVASVTNDFNGTNNASDTYPVGTTTVTWTVTDVNGNSSTCTQTVTITDGENPTISCPGNQTVSFDANCEYTLQDYTGMATAADNCSVTVTQSPASGTVITSTTTITLTATDPAGNMATCTFDVIPEDNTIPTITCPGNQTVSFDANCEYTLLDYTGMATTADNCGPITVTQSPASGTVITGTTTVTLTATDGNSNTATCTFDVVPSDNTPPTASCQNITVNLDATGNVSIAGADVDMGSSDNCSAVTLTVSPNSFTCADIGVNTVTLTVTDASGNSSTCTADVTVNDPNVPTASAGADATICSGDTYALSGSSGGSATSGSWATSGDGSFSSATDPNATYTPGPNDIANGSVTLTWTTDPSPCATDTDDMILTINPTPAPVAGSPVDPSGCGVCDGSITISGLDPSTTYDITYDDASGTQNLSGVTTDGSGNYVITGLCSGSYNNFTATLNGCTGTDASSIGLSDPGSPVFTASWVSDPTSCGGTDGVVEICGLNASTTYDNLDYNDGSGVINYGSFTTDGSGCFQLTGLAAASYSNFVVTLSGCTGNDAGPVVLTDPASPTPTAALVSDPTACGASDGALEICGLDPSTTYDSLVYDNSTGSVNYGSFMTDGSGCIQITGLMADSYSNFTVWQTGCSGADPGPVTLTDPNAPTFTASVVSDPTSCGASDGILEVCGLTASTTYDSLTYDDGTGTINIGSFTTDGAGCYQITGLPAGSYSNFNVTLSGCTGNDPGPVVLTDPNAPQPVSALVSDPTTCGGSDGIIEICGLTASTTYDSLSYDGLTGTVSVGSFTTDASGCYQITGLAAGSYSNFVVSLAGCTGTDAGPIVLTDPAAPSAPIAGTDTTYCEGDPVVDMTATGSGGTLTWYDDAGLTNVVGTGGNLSPFTGLGTTTYYVTETSASGCEGSPATVTITIEECVVLEVIIPTGFTPDGDGDNDVWEIQNLNVVYPNNTVRVYNRWGNLLFESEGYNTPWDGTYNGKDLPLGSYYFIIEFGDDSREPEKGSITIIR